MREVDGLDIVGEASDGVEALNKCLRLQPDVVVLDLDMPKMPGLKVTDQLRKALPDTVVLILSAYEDRDLIFGVLDRGAAGYLVKHESLFSIAEAIKGVAQGQTGWLSRRIAQLFVGSSAASNKPDPLADLSEREREVARCVAEGLSNREIADRLFVAESTVKKHVNSIFEKLGMQSRNQLIAWMWKNGLMA